MLDQQYRHHERKKVILEVIFNEFLLLFIHVEPAQQVDIMPLELGDNHIQENFREFTLLAIDNAVNLLQENTRIEVQLGLRFFSHLLEFSNTGDPDPEKLVEIGRVNSEELQSL